MYDAEYPFYEIAMRLGAAMLGGAILGIERQAKRKPAGLRTNMLVSLGAAATMLLTLDMCREMAALAMQVDISQTRVPNLDPLRTVSGIIGGVGFLGAGAIFKSEGDVEGLTTAAAIWTSAAIGMACGAGRFEIAATTVVLAFVILAVVDWVSRTVAPRETR